MTKLIMLALAVAANASFAAQTYKWVDERGVTNYGETPPSGRRAQAVDTTPGGTLEFGGIHQRRFEADARRAAAPQAPAPVVAVTPVRGMDFETYIRLQTGMSEGELLLRAGRPDHEAVENFRRDIVKSMYYYPTVANPHITVVTLRGGRIANIERTRTTF